MMTSGANGHTGVYRGYTAKVYPESNVAYVLSRVVVYRLQ